MTNPAAHEPWRTLVDLQKLAAWMDARKLGCGELCNVQSLGGGTQNILLRFDRGGCGFVLRRPPLSPYLNGDETIRRESRVLTALCHTNVPHARLIAACDDSSVIGAAFYLMEPVTGFCPAQGLPPLHASRPELRHGLALSVVDGLAALHTVDYRAAGLQGHGRPDGFLPRQVPRLMKQLDSYGAYQGWGGRADLRGVDEIAAWLSAAVPAEHAAGVVHGDFHLGNVLIAEDGPALQAIIDWELSTIGDPLMDLGGLLATWADADGTHPGCISVAPWSGFPSEAELVDRYAMGVRRDLSCYNWFVVLACLKLAVLLEGTHARACGGQADPAVGAWLHATSMRLLERALARI